MVDKLIKDAPVYCTCSLDTHEFIDSQNKNTREKEQESRQGNTTSYPRLRQGRSIANRPPPMASGTLMTVPAHFGITPVPAAWSQENQLPVFTAAPQKCFCSQAAAEPTVPKLSFYNVWVQGISAPFMGPSGPKPNMLSRGLSIHDSGMSMTATLTARAGRSCGCCSLISPI